MGILEDLVSKKPQVDLGYSVDWCDYHLTLPPVIMNPSCFGRENDMKEILLRLEEKKSLLVINGIGGIGKTRLCKSIYTTAEHQNTPIKFEHIAWVNYSNNIMDSFIHAFPSDWVSSPNATRQEKYRCILRKINSLAEKKNVLIIIDDVNHLPCFDPELVTLTQLRCYIIITSRLKLMEKNIYPLGLLKPEAGKELFLYHYMHDYPEREGEITNVLPDLLTLCGFHAMTIELLAKSFNTSKIEIRSAYQKLVKNHFDLSVFAKKITTEWDNEIIERSIAKHIGKLFSIVELPTRERELLHILSLFAPTEFPLSDLLRLLGKNVEPVLTSIIKKGWINCEKDTIVMHASVKFSIQYAYQKTSTAKYTYLLEGLCQELHWRTSHTEVTHLISHAEAAFISFKKSRTPHLLSLASRLSEYYLYEGNLKSSIYYLQQQVQILKALPNREKEIAECYKKIGVQYQELGNTKSAYRFHKKCLKMRKQFCLPLSFERSECYAHIAFYYQEIGQYWKALSNAKRALDIRIRLYGRDHSITAWSYNNLALLYFHLYEYGKALTLINHSIQIREKLFHEDDADRYELDIAQSKSIRGLIYQAMERFDEALNDQEESMEIRIRRLNKHHIITATSYCRVTSALCCLDTSQGLNRALDLSEAAIKIYVAISGEDTLDTAEAYLAKARVLRRKGEYYQAIELFVHSISIIETAYNKRHPRLSKILEELADIYLTCSEPLRAKKSYQRAYHIRVSFLPNGHWALEALKSKIHALD